jgi:hypothetical protein
MRILKVAGWTFGVLMLVVLVAEGMAWLVAGVQP